MHFIFQLSTIMMYSAILNALLGARNLIIHSEGRIIIQRGAPLLPPILYFSSLSILYLTKISLGVHIEIEKTFKRFTLRLFERVHMPL